MKYLKYIIILFILSNINLSFADKHETQLQNEITKNLRCLICQGQSIYDSDSQFANSLKILVEKKLSEGLSEKEIYQYFENKYGEWILYDPKFNKNTYFLWLLPILMFLLGGVILFKLFIIKKN
jgi:cytochrome c-type biogenesis protein CcmH|tara:strand:- start:121 stop:492 length:372 start_codon:yes stop_codon:yes gene_type:complete